MGAEAGNPGTKVKRFSSRLVCRGVKGKSETGWETYNSCYIFPGVDPLPSLETGEGRAATAKRFLWLAISVSILGAGIFKFNL